jgi:branched-chain amino acid transport system substrate-binding protein
LGESAEHIIGHTSWAATLPYKGETFGAAGDYVKLFKQKYGYAVDRTGASATNSGLIYQLAIERAGSLDVEKVREAVKELDDTTFYGPIRFDDEGVNIGTPTTVLQMRGGKHLAVYPPAHAETGVIYPIPK